MAQQPPFDNLESTREEARVAYEPADILAAAAGDSTIWQIHDALSQFLAPSTDVVATAEDAEISTFEAEALEGTGNVIGTAVTVATPTSTVWTAEPGAAALRIYLCEPMEESQLRDVLHGELGMPELTDDELPLEPIVTGEIRAFPHTFRRRPAPGGVSIGHVDITAGTLGCLARGRGKDRRERTLILSNNHVLANTNAGAFGDDIVQPGPVDGGTSPRDRIAVLERFVPIDFRGDNRVDCATAWADPELVQPEIVYLSKGQVRTFPIASKPRAARVGDHVGKSGRTTQLTSGRVTTVAANIRVRFGARVAFFRDQIEIVPLDPASGPFSNGGDSGSLIWTLDDVRQPVGLLFAGGGGSTFANPIEAVLEALDIELVGT